MEGVLKLVKVRLQGLPDEVEEILKQLREQFRILEESNQYGNRSSEYVRVYLDVEKKGWFNLERKLWILQRTGITAVLFIIALAIYIISGNNVSKYTSIFLGVATILSVIPLGLGHYD